MSLSGILFFFFLIPLSKRKKDFKEKNVEYFFEVFVEIFLDFVRILR